MEFKKYPSLTFEEPDFKTFRNLALATEALYKGGNMPCLLNAANEIAVQAFLDGKIGFRDIPILIEAVMNRSPIVPLSTLAEVLAIDAAARCVAQQVKEELSNS